MSCWRIREAFKGKWLKDSRRKLLVHGLIVVGFVLYCIFLAQPVFDRLEGIGTVKGESSLCDISLPAVTNDIKWGFEIINANNVEVVLRGWAFIKGQDMVDSRIFIVLKSESDTYVFDTVPRKRPKYVMQHYSDLNLDLVDSGFFAILPLRGVKQGNYTLGIYIKKDSIEALQYTDKTITKA